MAEKDEEELVAKAVDALKSGRLVAFPTETVYGLGADASNREALELLYRTKGRPNTHPSIVHLASPEQVGQWAVDVPPAAQLLADLFWPGPLTMVLKKAPHVLPELTGGQDTVAIRIPDQRLALMLLQEFAHGIAAPSANRFGRISATSAEDVEAEFGNEVAVILNGGPCPVGIESTIVDLSGARPRILRPGMILKESINVALGELELEAGEGDATAPRVPGSLPSHYAPSKRVELSEHNAVSEHVAALEKSGKKAGVLAFAKPVGSSENWLQVSQQPGMYAHHLYRLLRRLDNADVDLIVVETPPAEPEWAGINDRLMRAAGRREGETADGS